MTQINDAFKRQQLIGRKPGNTAWCQCAACDGWFHLGPSILSQETVHLHCPHCHDEFAAKTAKRILFPKQSEKT